MNWTSIKNIIVKIGKKYFTSPVLLAFLFILLSHPLFYAVSMLAQSFSPQPLDVLPGVIYYFPQTGIKLVTYILSIPLFFLYYGFFFYLIHHPGRSLTKKYLRILRSWKKTLLWFALAFIAVVLAKHVNSGALKLLLALAPLIFPLIQKNQWQFIWNKILPPTLVCTVLGSLVWLGYMTLPFIFTPLQVENDYLNIPTGLKPQAFLSQPSQPEKKNVLLLNKLPATDQDFMAQYNSLITPAKRQAWCMNVSDKNKSLARMTKSTRWNTIQSFWVQDGKLCLQWILDEEVKKHIQNQMTPPEQREFTRLYAQLWNEYDKLATPSFEDKKQYPVFELLHSQIHWQTLARGFIHHHNHLFGAAHAYLKGQPLHQIFMQYGFFNTVGIAVLLDNTVGFNYSNYVHFYYIFYPLYYIFLFWFGWILLKNAKYWGMQILLSVGALSFSTYMFLKLAPGINPARHFFDIFTVVTLYLYLSKKNKAWLLLSVVSVWAGILNNMHFGTFIFISLVGVLFIKNITDWKNRNRFELFSLALLILGGATALFFANVGSKEVEGYFLNGLLGFEIRNTLLYIILTTTGLMYLLLAYNWKTKNPLNYTLLLLIFYSQGVMLYFLRSAVIIHFYTMLSTFALTGVIALKLLLGIVFKNRPERENTAATILLLAAAAFFFASISPCKASKKDMLIKFKNRQMYSWTLPNTFFTTTMPEQPFTQGAALINKYNQGPGVYMISQYDNLFPLISDKYNSMPFIDVQWYMITQREFDLTVNTIKENRPEYIFVDTDISRNYYLDIIQTETPIIGYLKEESLWRAQRLTQMQKVFEAVKNDYEPIEKSELITAYRLKNTEN